ncbi:MULTISPECIES: right-handed parallel beta-helix repeat-containing protein [unclassified Mesorhizobium]|uniref:right-handed parallel beta-helix repeat-containing protein n=1 Tax=unclassified Mesorhizobium TaxID=325217 RepID=UPI0033396859
MKMLRFFFSFAILILASGFLIAPASAQATRTWVSGVGDDANPCSRTAPCKTFAGAISKTATGGIINCIDPGGFGAVTITKSMTISCKHVEGSILASGVTGVIINGAGVDVVLRGLDVDGSNGGVNGIRFLQGASLIVEDCIIRDFTAAAPAGSGNGILVNNTALVTEIHVSNSYITGNSRNGISIEPGGSGGATLMVKNSVLSNNLVGLLGSTGTTTGSVDISVTDTVVAGGGAHGFSASAGSGALRVMLNRVTSANNGDSGIRSANANSVVRVGSSVISGNGTGLNTLVSGQIQSYGNNQIDGNVSPGVAPTPVALK